MICEPLKCTGTRFSDLALRGSSDTRTGLPATTYQLAPENWYMSQTKIQTSKLTTRYSRDSNRDLIRVLGVAALIWHGRHGSQINLIFQYLAFHDLVLDDLIDCARRRCSRDGPCPPSARTQESRRFFASFRSLGWVDNVYLLGLRMCADACILCHLWNVWHDYRRYVLTRDPDVRHVDAAQVPAWQFAIGEHTLIVQGHLQQRLPPYGFYRENTVLGCLHFFC